MFLTLNLIHLSEISPAEDQDPGRLLLLYLRATGLQGGPRCLLHHDGLGHGGGHLVSTGIRASEVGQSRPEIKISQCPLHLMWCSWSVTWTTVWNWSFWWTVTDFQLWNKVYWTMVGKEKSLSSNRFWCKIFVQTPDEGAWMNWLQLCDVLETVYCIIVVAL